MKKAIAFFLAAAILGCTENERVRSFGGTQTIQLAPGVRLVNVTWKASELWILTRPVNPQGDSKPTTYTFQEKSSFGLMEGTLVLVER